MRRSKLCFGVLVLLLIANCEAKNDESSGEGARPDDERYDYDYYSPDSNQDTVNSAVGPRDHTPTSADDVKHYNSGDWDSSTITDAPGLKVTINGSNENNRTAVLVCDARSVPGEITFSPWVHMWGGRVIRHGLQGRHHDHINLLIINNLSLRDMGTYICSGASGIKGTKTHIESENLKVTGLPIVLFETSIFSGKIGHPINISIPFYSDPAIERFYIRANGTILPNTSGSSIDIVNESIDYMMYGMTVKLEAQILQFVIPNLSSRHLDNYTLVLTNPIGHKEFTFQLLLFEKTGRLSVAFGLMVVGVIALLIAGTLEMITIFLFKKASQGKQSREENEPGKENTTVNIIYVLAGEVTGEHETLRAKTTDDILCSETPGKQPGDDRESGNKDVVLEKQSIEK